MYNEYYKSWIPDVNVEKLKQNGFYKNIVKDISDEDIIYAWDSQVYTLGVQTYDKTGYLEYCSCEGCLVHSQYNYNLLTLATVLKLFLLQRGGDGSLSLTGQITFAEAAVLKTGMSKDWDRGYNSSQYGSPYYNLSTLTKELMVIVNKNVTRTRFSNIKTNMAIQCKRPTGTIFESDTLRVSQTDQKISFNLWLSQNDMLKSEYLNIKYTVQGQPYLDFNAQSLLIVESNTISIEPNKEGNLEARAIISKAVGNKLEAKEDGLYSSGSSIDFPVTIEQGGTGQTNKEDALLALLPNTLDQEGKVLSVYKKDDGTTGVKWIAIPNINNYVQGDGIDISDVDPVTGFKTISSKVNSSEFRYNNNGVMELSDQITNALEKAESSVQTVNQIPPDNSGNVNVEGSQPVLALISDFEPELSTVYNWVLAQPNSKANLYFKTKTIPEILVSVSANRLSTTWESFCTYVRGSIQKEYDGVPNFTFLFNNVGRLEASTNDILNPIDFYIPSMPNPETNSLNGILQLLPPNATIVSQPYATINQVNTIVNTAVLPLQQDISLLNLDMFFADYYIGISINYLLSGKWDGDEVSTYNEILSQLNDTNTLTFTLATAQDQFPCPLIITKQQFIDCATLDDFTNYISAQMLEKYDIKNFAIIFKELGTQGFLITNLDSNKGVLVCEEDNNNLAVIMKLTDLTGAKDRIYTDFSNNSLQAQITNNQLIIDDVFVNNIKNGENVTINADPATNTATFNLSSAATAALTKAESALQEITVDKLQGLDISTKTANKQNITINNATKTSKGVAQAGDNIEANNGVLSTQGGGGGGIKTIDGIAPNSDGNFILNAQDGLEFLTNTSTQEFKVLHTLGLPSFKVFKINYDALSVKTFSWAIKVNGVLHYCSVNLTNETFNSYTELALIIEKITQSLDYTQYNLAKFSFIYINDINSFQATTKDVTQEINYSLGNNSSLAYLLLLTASNNGIIDNQYISYSSPLTISGKQLMKNERQAYRAENIVSIPTVESDWNGNSISVEMINANYEFSTNVIQKILIKQINSLNDDLGSSYQISAVNGDAITIYSAKFSIPQHIRRQVQYVATLNVPYAVLQVVIYENGINTPNQNAEWIITWNRTLQNIPLIDFGCYAFKNWNSQNYSVVYNDLYKYFNVISIETLTNNPYQTLYCNVVTLGSKIGVIFSLKAGGIDPISAIQYYDVPMTSNYIFNDGNIKITFSLNSFTGLSGNFINSYAFKIVNSDIDYNVISELSAIQNIPLGLLQLGGSRGLPVWNNQVWAYDDINDSLDIYLNISNMLPSQHNNEITIIIKNPLQNKVLINNKLHIKLNQDNQTIIGSYSMVDGYYLIILPDIAINGYLQIKFNINYNMNSLCFVNITSFSKTILGLQNTMNTGISQGQINLGLGRRGIWEGINVLSPQPSTTIPGIEFDLAQNALTIEGGGTLNIKFSSTFNLSNAFVENVTKLKLAMVNVVNSEDYFAVDVEFENIANLNQTINQLTLNCDLTDFSNKKSYKIIFYSDAPDANVTLSVVDYLTSYFIYNR